MSDDNAPDEGGPAARDAYRELFERSADAILIIEGDRFVDCNQATVDMLRLPSKEAVLRTHPSELSPDYQPDGQRSFDKANEMIRTAFEHGSHRFEWDHRRADGEVFPVEVLLTAVKAGDNPTLHVVWRDITDRKQLEADLRQAQKMEAIGNLAGGIAHDFNNVLVAILGNAELVMRALKGAAEPAVLERLAEIRFAGKRAAELTQQLLAYSRKQALELRAVDLVRVLTDLKIMARRVVGEDVDLRMRVGSEPVVVRADPGQLQQVLLNLVANARDATPSGGSITIELDTVARAPVADGASRSFARLSVSDTGQGIDPADLSKIFDPFFTTKPRGRGTGLGLSTVQGIVRQSGGEIDVQSTTGQGTRFEVLLPLTEEVPVETGERDAASRRDLAGDEHILVVEDEDPVADVIIGALQSSGYRATRARNGAEALGLLQARETPFALIVSDVIMPVMGGGEMLRRLGDHETRVLFVSGYTDRALSERGGIPEGVELLRKPFSIDELLVRVRDLLDR